jgi:cyclophilin family peptidyl-prolyl cis-trans isomerase
MTTRRTCALGLVAALLLAVSPPYVIGQTRQTPAPAGKAAPKSAPSKVAPAAPAKPTPGAGPLIVVETAKGTFEIETYPKDAPKTVARMLQLAKARFFNGLRIHRVVPGFVVQMGDPQTRDMTRRADWGNGGSGKTIGVAELSKTLKHVRGAVAMAHAGNPAEADSQFYICLDAAPKLDGQFVVWGKVLNGMDVVAKLKVEDRIIRMTVKE